RASRSAARTRAPAPRELPPSTRWTPRPAPALAAHHRRGSAPPARGSPPSPRRRSRLRAGCARLPRARPRRPGRTRGPAAATTTPSGQALPAAPRPLRRERRDRHYEQPPAIAQRRARHSPPPPTPPPGAPPPRRGAPPLPARLPRDDAPLGPARRSVRVHAGRQRQPGAARRIESQGVGTARAAGCQRDDAVLRRTRPAPAPHNRHPVGRGVRYRNEPLPAPRPLGQ